MKSQYFTPRKLKDFLNYGIAPNTVLYRGEGVSIVGKYYPNFDTGHMTL